MGHPTAFRIAYPLLQKFLSYIGHCHIFRIVANVGISVASLQLAGEGEGCDGPASGMPQPLLRTLFTGTFSKE